MVPDDILKKVGPSSLELRSGLLISFAFAVHDSNDGQPERAVAHSQADDSPDGVLHLPHLCDEHGRACSFAHPLLSLEREVPHLRHATLYVLLLPDSLLPESSPRFFPAAIVPNKPEFVNAEAVPFRFTPNLQRFITPIGTEGLLTSSMMAIARCLTESEVRPFSLLDLDVSLSFFLHSTISNTD